MDGKAYPLEVHFVHGNTKYKKDGKYTDASVQPDNDGLLVIGVFYEIGADGTQNPWVAPQAELAKKYATNPTATTTSNQENMWNTLKTALENGHYNYKGSLTTPGNRGVLGQCEYLNQCPLINSTFRLQRGRHLGGRKNPSQK